MDTYHLNHNDLARANYEYAKWLRQSGHKRTLLKKYKDTKDREAILDYYSWLPKKFTPQEDLWNIYQVVYRNKANKTLKDAEHRIFQSFKKPSKQPISPIIKHAFDYLKKRKIYARMHNFRSRLIWELITYQTKPQIFITLTVDNAHYQEVFKPKSKAWPNFIKQLKKAGLKSYACVTEEASRLHLHAVLIFNSIPKTWQKDPNDYLNIPTRREIIQIKSLWPYGFITAIAIRYNSTDYFSQLGWKWPETKTGPLKPSNPAKLGGYLAKYLTKTKGAAKWKTKTTPNLGTTPLKTILTNLSQTERHLILKHLHLNWRISEIPVPKTLLKNQILRLEINLEKPAEHVYLKGFSGQWKTLTQKTGKTCIYSSTDDISTTNTKNMDIFNIQTKWEKLANLYKIKGREALPGWTRKRISL